MGNFGRLPGLGVVVLSVSYNIVGLYFPNGGDVLRRFEKNKRDIR